MHRTLAAAVALIISLSAAQPLAAGDRCDQAVREIKDILERTRLDEISANNVRRALATAENAGARNADEACLSAIGEIRQILHLDH